MQQALADAPEMASLLPPQDAETDAKLSLGISDASAVVPPAIVSASRAVQIVSTRSDRVKVVQWMLARHDAGESAFISKAVKSFPGIFCANNKANLQKASNWWHRRDQIMAYDEEESPEVLPGDGADTIIMAPSGPRKRLRVKAGAGRGPKRAPWVVWLHEQMLRECLRLQRFQVAISVRVLTHMAVELLTESTGEFNAGFCDRDGKLIRDKITHRWIQSFCDRYGVVIERSKAKSSKAKSPS